MKFRGRRETGKGSVSLADGSFETTTANADVVVFLKRVNPLTGKGRKTGSGARLRSIAKKHTLLLLFPCILESVSKDTIFLFPVDSHEVFFKREHVRGINSNSDTQKKKRRISFFPTCKKSIGSFYECLTFFLEIFKIDTFLSSIFSFFFFF